VLLAIQTPSSAGRPWIIWECGVASGLTNQRLLIPVLYGMDAERLPAPLASYTVYSGQSRQQVQRVCEQLAAAAAVPLTDASLNAALDNYEKAVSTHPSIANAASVRDIEDARRKARDFCERVAGWWFERIKKDGIGFFQLQMDDRHSAVRMTNGHYFDESGRVKAYYNSAMARIEDNDQRRGIVYMRECRNPVRDGHEWFHGYGDMWFEGSGAAFDQGHGSFCDITVRAPKKMLSKAVALRRLADQNDIDTILKGSPEAQTALAVRLMQRPDEQLINCFLTRDISALHNRCRRH
jgi:hypothetical protein